MKKTIIITTILTALFVAVSFILNMSYESYGFGDGHVFQIRFEGFSGARHDRGVLIHRDGSLYFYKHD